MSPQQHPTDMAQSGTGPEGKGRTRRHGFNGASGCPCETRARLGGSPGGEQRPSRERLTPIKPCPTGDVDASDHALCVSLEPSAQCQVTSCRRPLIERGSRVPVQVWCLPVLDRQAHAAPGFLNGEHVVVERRGRVGHVGKRLSLPCRLDLPDGARQGSWCGGVQREREPRASLPPSPARAPELTIPGRTRGIDLQRSLRGGAHACGRQVAAVRCEQWSLAHGDLNIGATARGR